MNRTVTRQAEGLVVEITEPSPRRVTIRSEGDYSYDRSFSIQEAEGLLYALTAALADVKADR